MAIDGHASECQNAALLGPHGSGEEEKRQVSNEFPSMHGGEMAWDMNDEDRDHVLDGGAHSVTEGLLHDNRHAIRGNHFPHDNNHHQTQITFNSQVPYQSTVHSKDNRVLVVSLAQISLLFVVVVQNSLPPATLTNWSYCWTSRYTTAIYAPITATSKILKHLPLSAT